MSEFAVWLTAQRNSRNWTQDDVAERVGVDKQQVYRWESGRNVPSPNRLKSIARLYGIEPDELIAAVKADRRPPEPAPDARDNTVQVSFFARQKLRKWAVDAGMPNEAVWLTHFANWLEEMPEMFRAYLLDSVHADFEPSFGSVVDEPPPPIRPPGTTAANHSG